MAFRVAPPICLLFFALPLVPHINANCNIVAVAKCYADLLNDWAKDLWEIKQDIALLNAESCERFHKINDCVNYQDCDKNATIYVSKLVNDLLQHSRDSGTFLQSFYAIEYACQPDGQDILSTQRDCLREHHMGDELLTGVSKLSADMTKRKKENPEGNRDAHWTAENCQLLTTWADQFEHNTAVKCGDRAGLLICKSFASPFLHIQPELFGSDCSPCEPSEATGQPEITPTPSESDSGEAEPEDQHNSDEEETESTPEADENEQMVDTTVVPTLQQVTGESSKRNSASLPHTEITSTVTAIFSTIFALISLV